MHDPGDTPAPPDSPGPPDPWLPPREDVPHQPAPPPTPSDAQARHALGLDRPKYAPGSRDIPTTIVRPDTLGPATTADLVRAVIAWTLILACTVILIVLQAVGMSEMEKEVAEDPRPGFNALYLARYSVGMDQLMSGSGGQVVPAFREATAGSPHVLQNQTRLAILAAEVEPPHSLDRELHMLRTQADMQPRGAVAADDAELVLRIYDESYTPTTAERDGLVARHGWFGEMAATFNLPKTDPAHKAPRRSGMVVVVSLVSLFGVIVLAFIAGLGLLILFTILLVMGKMKLHGPRGPASHRTAYLEATALFLVLFIGLQVVLGLAMLVTDIDLTLVMLVGVAAALLWPLAAGVRWAQFKVEMGYHTGQGLCKEVGMGVVGYLAGLPIVGVGMGITMLLTAFAEGGGDHPLQYELMEGGAYTVLLTLGAAVVWAPLVEESVFRSAFYRHLRQRRGVGGWALATLVTAFIFAAIHPQGWVGVPVLMSIAIVFAAMREWRGTIVPSMVAHALHNGTLTVMLGIILFA